MALSTVSGILTRIGIGKLGRLGLEPAVRYERQTPGELIHIDIKKLGEVTLDGVQVAGVGRGRDQLDAVGGGVGTDVGGPVG